MSLLRNLSIARKLAASFTTLVVVTGVVGGLSYSQLSFIRQSDEGTEHSYRVIEQLQNMAIGVSAQVRRDPRLSRRSRSEIFGAVSQRAGRLRAGRG